MILDGFLLLGGGLLGSAHCIGMCGPIVVTIGGASAGAVDNLARQILHGLGRIFTYAFLGAVGGFVGLEAARRLSSALAIQPLLAIVAGLFLCYQGARALGWRGLGASAAPSASACQLAGLLGGLTRQPGRTNALILGVLNGFLPCGLVYAFLSLAISTGDVFKGMLVMTLFGLGTLPALVLTGCGGALLAPARRHQLLRGAACLVIVTGFVALGRGTLGLIDPERPAAAACPFCEVAESSSQGESAFIPLGLRRK